jgi:mannose-1-phosphate guanylyltransferase
VVDGANNILVSETEHLLAVLGVDDLIVIHSADATLICRKGQEQKIKELAEQRRRDFGEQYE